MKLEISQPIVQQETSNVSDKAEKPKRRARKPRTTPDAIAQIERVQKAIQMRKSGFSYVEIARDLNWKSPQAAFDAVAKALDRVLLDEAREYKLLSLMRLESCIAAVLKKAENGNLLAVDRIIKLSKREGEILGFDEAKNADANGGFEIVVRDETQRNK